MPLFSSSRVSEFVIFGQNLHQNRILCSQGVLYHCYINRNMPQKYFNQYRVKQFYLSTELWSGLYTFVCICTTTIHSLVTVVYRTEAKKFLFTFFGPKLFLQKEETIKREKFFLDGRNRNTRYFYSHSKVASFLKRPYLMPKYP